MKIADEFYETLSQAALASFGGLIGALMRKEASTWQTALLGAIGAGFVGLLVAHFCHATGVSDDMTFVFVGVSGWLGAQRTIDYLERLIEGKFGVKFEPDEAPDHTAANSPAAGEHSQAPTERSDSR
jgi:hypothetical protein